MLLVVVPVAAAIGLVELDFIPAGVADLWRVLLWLAIVAVGSRILADAIGGGGLPSTRMGRWALLVLLGQNCVLLAERWGQSPALEYTPVATLAVVLAWLSTRRYTSPAEVYARHQTNAAGGRMGQRR